MLKIGTRVEMSESSTWWRQAYKDGKKYGGLVVATTEDQHPDYPHALVRPPFSYAVAWDHEIKTTAGQYMYRPTDIVRVRLDNNEQAASLLIQEESIPYEPRKSF